MAAGLPRPEPSPAGKLDVEMKRKRTSTSFLTSLVLVGALAITTQVMAPPAALGRIAPVTTVSGDPDDPEAPSPGPRKTTQPSAMQAVPLDGRSEYALGLRQVWLFILIRMLRFERP